MSCIRPATPGTVVVFAATVLLVLVSVSVPLFKSIYFLKADVASYEVTLGTWGYCAASNCSKATLGYSIDVAQLFDYSGVDGIALTQELPNAVIKGLTYVLVLHPAAAGFAGISLVLGLLAHLRGFGGTCWTTFFASLGASTALLAFAFDLALFIIAKKRIESSAVGGTAMLGNAIWMTLAAALLLMFSGCFFGCGGRMVKERKSKREASEKSRPSVDPEYGAHMRNTGYGYGPNMPVQQPYQPVDNGLPKFAEIRDGEAIPLTHMNDKDEDDEIASHHYNDSPHRFHNVVGGGSAISGVGQGYGRRSDGPISPTSPTTQNRYAGGYHPAPPRHPESILPGTVEPFTSMSPGPQSPTRDHYGANASSPMQGPGQPMNYHVPTSPQQAYASYGDQHQNQGLPVPFAAPQRPASTGVHGPRDFSSSSPPNQQPLHQQHQANYSDPFQESTTAYHTAAPEQYAQNTGTVAPSYHTHQPDFSHQPDYPPQNDHYQHQMNSSYDGQNQSYGGYDQGQNQQYQPRY